MTENNDHNKELTELSLKTAASWATIHATFWIANLSTRTAIGAGSVLYRFYAHAPSHRQVPGIGPGSSQPNLRATRYLGEIWVSDCMLQRLHARLLSLLPCILHTVGVSHTLRESVLFIGTRFSNLYTAVDTPARGRVGSLDSYCRPTAGKCSSPAGLSTRVYAYVVDFAPASPTHTPRPHAGFPMSAHLSRLRLFERHLQSLFRVWVWVWDGFRVWVSTSSSRPHPAHTHTH